VLYAVLFVKSVTSEYALTYTEYLYKIITVMPSEDSRKHDHTGIFRPCLWSGIINGKEKGEKKEKEKKRRKENKINLLIFCTLYTTRTLVSSANSRAIGGTDIFAILQAQLAPPQ
jgi:hypothetical protein